MYPAMLRTFTHIFPDDYGLLSGQQVDVYEQVGMFLCILSHRKGYRQVQTLFNCSLETVGHYFKIVLTIAVEFDGHVTRPNSNYDHGTEHHVLNLNNYSLFQDCIGVIDGTYVRAVSPRDERVNFTGCKGIPAQNVLATCDFNLCLTFMLAGLAGTMHDSHILTHAIHSLKIDF